MADKKLIFMISDLPLFPSGVGTQTKYVIDALIKTGRYKIMCFGGAIKHQNYNPIKIEEYGDDFIAYPVDGYGTQDMVRSAIRQQRPDLLWFMTDPRFYEWLWQIEDEVRPLIPMVYYHVWDNYPYPKFNKKFYDSNDFIACISKLTHDVVKTVAPDVESEYVPHAVDSAFFKPLDPQLVKTLRIKNFGPDAENKFIVFWNNRNARRKMSGSIVYWFSKFAEKVGKDKVLLVMHTEPKDQEGQDIESIAENFGLTNENFMVSRQKIPPQDLAAFYNVVDCTVNVADAEGFGLATLESLSCETPIIVNMTGGLQEQVTDGKDWFGIGIEPASKALIGMQQAALYIYEDRVSEKDFIDALTKMYNLPAPERKLLGKKGREHVMKNYNFDTFNKQWIDIIDRTIEKHGSWPTKNYKPYKLVEL